MKQLSVSVIIPNFNGEELIGKHMPNVIKAYTNKDNYIKEIIVVDDASTDRSVSLLKKFFKEVRVYRHKKNRGFSSSVNTGARYAKGDLLCLLNTDVSPAVDFLVPVFIHFEDTTTFAVSLHEEGYGWAKGFFRNGFIEHQCGPESTKPHDTFWASGGSAVFSRKKWWELGGLDEKNLSPFYWEDFDIGYRGAKRGWKLLWEPKAKVIHQHESTTSKLPKIYRQRIQERNQLIVIWKNITSRVLFRKHIRILIRKCLSHPGYLRIVYMALKKLPTIYEARLKEKKEEKVSDEAIFAKFTNA